MAAEAGNKREAERFFGACMSAIGDPTWDWAVEARQELETCLREAGTEKLKQRLATIQINKLKALHLDS